MVLKNLLTGSNGETDIENRLTHVGRGEERVRCMERITWKLTVSYVKLPYVSGKSYRGSVST